MATLNKQLMIDTIRNDNNWLRAAVLRIDRMASENTITLTSEQQYDINYWSGWLRAGKTLSGTHRNKAIDLMATTTIADALWECAVNSTTKEASK